MFGEAFCKVKRDFELIGGPKILYICTKLLLSFRRPMHNFLGRFFVFAIGIIISKYSPKSTDLV